VDAVEPIPELIFNVVIFKSSEAVSGVAIIVVMKMKLIYDLSNSLFDNSL
jgi:hypothetical protein